MSPDQLRPGMAVVDAWGNLRLVETVERLPDGDGRVVWSMRTWHGRTHRSRSMLRSFASRHEPAEPGGEAA